jgi:hypothetical protein
MPAGDTTSHRAPAGGNPDHKAGLVGFCAKACRMSVIAVLMLLCEIDLDDRK